MSVECSNVQLRSKATKLCHQNISHERMWRSEVSELEYGVRVVG